MNFINIFFDSIDERSKKAQTEKEASKQKEETKKANKTVKKINSTVKKAEIKQRIGQVDHEQMEKKRLREEKTRAKRKYEENKEKQREEKKKRIKTLKKMKNATENVISVPKEPKKSAPKVVESVQEVFGRLDTPKNEEELLEKKILLDNIKKQANQLHQQQKKGIFNQGVSSNQVINKKSRELKNRHNDKKKIGFEDSKVVHSSPWMQDCLNDLSDGYKSLFYLCQSYELESKKCEHASSVLLRDAKGFLQQISKEIQKRKKEK